MSLDVTKMRKVNFRMNELLKYETIKELVDYNSNKNRAMQNLGISRSQVDRLIIIYKEKENLVLSTETEDISPKKH